MVTRIQAVVAVAVPWLLAVVLVPGSAWAWLGLLVPLVFAALHARDWQAWSAPVSGTVSVLPGVPGWASLIAALATTALLLVRPPASVYIIDREHRNHRRVVVAGGALIVFAVVLATELLVQVQSENASFEASQSAAAEVWATLEPDPPEASAPEPAVVGGLVGQPLEVQAEAAAPVSPPFARMRFLRKGSDEPVVTDRILYVGPDVTERGLAAGPGRYPGTGQLGRPGNVAVAGHRTGWGSPFLNLDDLAPGDRIKLVDREGIRHTYVVRESRLVAPSEDWVLGPDPLGTGEPTLTLTTCDPPEVNTERLIVFATLAKSVPLPSA